MFVKKKRDVLRSRGKRNSSLYRWRFWKRHWIFPERRMREEGSGGEARGPLRFLSNLCHLGAKEGGGGRQNYENTKDTLRSKKKNGMYHTQRTGKRSDILGSLVGKESESLSMADSSLSRSQSWGESSSTRESRERGVREPSEEVSAAEGRKVRRTSGGDVEEWLS